MELTTEEGNRIIAKFMGGKWHNNFECWLFPVNPGNEAELQYHRNWSWLIPVVEKIEAIEDDYYGHFGVYISSNSCTIQATNFRPDKPITDPPHYFSEHYGSSKIQATWLAVVAFFQWYNSLPSIDTNLIKKNKEG